MLLIPVCGAHCSLDLDTRRAVLRCGPRCISSRTINKTKDPVFGARMRLIVGEIVPMSTQETIGTRASAVSSSASIHCKTMRCLGRRILQPRLHVEHRFRWQTLFPLEPTGSLCQTLAGCRRASCLPRDNCQWFVGREFVVTAAARGDRRQNLLPKRLAMYVQSHPALSCPAGTAGVNADAARTARMNTGRHADSCRTKRRANRAAPEGGPPCRHRRHRCSRPRIRPPQRSAE